MKRLIDEEGGSSSPKLARITAMVSQHGQTQRQLNNHQHHQERQSEGQRQQVRENCHNNNRGPAQQKEPERRDSPLLDEDVRALEKLDQQPGQQQLQQQNHKPKRDESVIVKTPKRALLPQEHVDYERPSQEPVRHTEQARRDTRDPNCSSEGRQQRKPKSRHDGLEQGETRHEQPQRSTVELNVEHGRGEKPALDTASITTNSNPQGTAYSVQPLGELSPASGREATPEVIEGDVVMKTSTIGGGEGGPDAEVGAEMGTRTMNSPQQQQRAQGTAATAPSTRSSGVASGDAKDRDKMVRPVRQQDADDKERKLGDDGGSNRRTRDPTTVGALHGGVKLLPVNCPEKLVFIADCGVETGLPCGQFMDGSSARVLDALKKAIRLVASRRAAMNSSAQVGLLEWGRTPRWRMQPHGLSPDSTALETALEKLNPATANEELCDINALLNTIREKTGLPTTWDGGHPPFVVRAIIFYCRFTPPLCSAGTSRNAQPLSAKTAQGDPDGVATSTSTPCANLTDHPLFTLDAVFVLRRDACLKPQPKEVPVVSAPTEDENKTAEAEKSAGEVVQADNATDPMAADQGQEGVGIMEEQNEPKVFEQRLLGEQQPPATEAMMIDNHEEDNKKAVRNEAVQQAQSVFDWLHSVCTLSSYILPCAPSPFQVLQQCCRLLGHPLQRPPQHLADYRLRPAAVRQLNQPSPAETVPQSIVPSGHGQMTGDRESSTESSSTLSRLDDESVVDMGT